MFRLLCVFSMLLVFASGCGSDSSASNNSEEYFNSIRQSLASQKYFDNIGSDVENPEENLYSFIVFTSENKFTIYFSNGDTEEGSFSISWNLKHNYPELDLKYHISSAEWYYLIKTDDSVNPGTVTSFQSWVTNKDGEDVFGAVYLPNYIPDHSAIIASYEGNNTSNNTSGNTGKESYEKKAIEVYLWCQDRFEYYDKRDGYYTGDKYDNEVMEDAADHFDVSVEEVKKLYEDGGVYNLRNN